MKKILRKTKRLTALLAENAWRRISGQPRVYGVTGHSAWSVRLDDVARIRQRFRGPHARRRNDLVVSLTTYPARFKLLPYSLFSLVSQTIQPQRIVVWLTESDVPQGEEGLPAELLDFRRWGVEFRFYKKAIRSYTKIIPSLEAFPDSILLTVDDDHYYSPKLFERLLDAHDRHPEMIHANRMHRVRMSNDTYVPYRQWQKGDRCLKDTRGSFWNLLLGYGGVVYPPHVFDSRVLDSEKFMRLAPGQDDLWLWANALSLGVKVAGLARPLWPNPLADPENRDKLMQQSLQNENIYGDGNDRAIAALEAEYGLAAILQGESSDTKMEVWK